MSTQALAKREEPVDPYADIDLTVMERVVTLGDLSKLEPEDRFTLYLDVCRSLQLNPLTQPFAYIRLNGQLKLYARKDCAEQLRYIHQVSVTLSEPSQKGSIWMQKASAEMPRRGGGTRVDESMGAVNISGCSGESLANAVMKCETKAKRRVTLSICGLGAFADESELSSMGKVEYVAMEEAQRAPVAAPREQETAPPQPPRPSVPSAPPPPPEPQVYEGEFVQEQSSPSGASVRDDSHDEPDYSGQEVIQSDDELAMQFCQALANARDIDELKEIQKKIMGLEFEPQDLQPIKEAFNTRRAFLKGKS